MAITVPSTATASGSGGSVTVTKPTGLAVGEMLVALMSANDSGTGTIDTPSGWTKETTASAVNLESAVLWKVADSGDVAASNFTFTHSAGAGSVPYVALLRVTGLDTTNIPEAEGTGTTTTNTSTASFSISQTLRVPNNLQVIVISGETTSGGEFTTFTGTPTPSYTQVFELTTVGAAHAFVMGYQIISDDTTITAFGCNSDVTMDEVCGVVTVFRENYPSSGTTNLFEPTTNLFTPTGRADTNATASLLEATTTFFEETTTATSPTQWTEEDTPTTTWTNEDI